MLVRLLGVGGDGIADAPARVWLAARGRWRQLCGHVGVALPQKGRGVQNFVPPLVGRFY